MKDKEYNDQKKRIGKYLTKWQDSMGLRWWDIQVVWDRSYCTSNSAAGAETEMNSWKYRRADITFYVPKIAEEKDDKEVERLVVHELCHVLLSPISTNMDDLNSSYQVQINEFTTELVASAFLWVQEANKKQIKK